LIKYSDKLGQNTKELTNGLKVVKAITSNAADLQDINCIEGYTNDSKIVPVLQKNLRAKLSSIPFCPSSFTSFTLHSSLSPLGILSIRKI
jgi:hypothetical protein